MSPTEPRRATCECGRAFVAEDGMAECEECQEYARGSIASMLPTPGKWTPPRRGCDLPRKGPWREDPEEGGVA